MRATNKTARTNESNHNSNLLKNNSKSRVKYWPPTWEQYLPKKQTRQTISINCTDQGK